MVLSLINAMITYVICRFLNIQYNKDIMLFPEFNKDHVLFKQHFHNDIKVEYKNILHEYFLKLVFKHSDWTTFVFLMVDIMIVIALFYNDWMNIVLITSLAYIISVYVMPFVFVLFLKQSLLKFNPNWYIFVLSLIGVLVSYEYISVSGIIAVVYCTFYLLFLTYIGYSIESDQYSDIYMYYSEGTGEDTKVYEIKGIECSLLGNVVYKELSVHY